ncbi:tyrosine-type recombinase/integrase [Photobacterium galatheae]|uniref:Integrase n=1 Tax=Photobacterium galatheae TaxID=1654360 RepID=A0A066RHV0_9GAMM|nr:tyrosine-type recombinase/integrase [Photobacterium galatheae]KDM89904.1 integrase [Photobacterium galatheae]MCM0149740.1 tyrosine-type recombinase/integrase [Photobacterium galatheae]
MKKIPTISNESEKQRSIQTFSLPIEDVEVWKILTHQQYSANTLLAFKNDWNHFLSFCLEKHACALPASVKIVHEFIDQMAQKRKLASLKRYIVTIGLVHRCHALPDPCRHTEVRLVLNRYRLEKQDDYKNAAAFRDDHLQRLAEHFSLATKPKDVRDFAIWSIMFEAMLKRSELTALTVEHLEIAPSGLITLNVKEHAIGLSTLASQALQRWLTIGIIETGNVFRRIDRHGNVGDQPLDHSSIYRVFRRAGDELGISHDTIFSGQSPRVGAVKDLSDAGVSIHDIQSQGRWKSPAMPAQYAGHKDKHDTEIAKYVKNKPWQK